MYRRVFIGLGSNKGNAAKQMRAALKALHYSGVGRIHQVSSYYQTSPVGVTNQDNFLNAVCAIQTVYQPHVILERLQQIETRLGRVRTVRWGSRVIDMDLLLFEDRILSSPDLIVPHPRLHERKFVLQPLCEIAPHVIHPCEKKTIKQLLVLLQTHEMIRKCAQKKLF